MAQHKQRSQEEWKRIIAEQESSGLSAFAFCKRSHIQKSSFYAWKHRLAGSPRPTSDPVESFIDMGQVVPSKEASSASGSLVVTLDLGAGARLTIRQG